VLKKHWICLKKMKINNLIYREEEANLVRPGKLNFLRRIYKYFYFMDFHSILRYETIINEKVIKNFLKTKKKIIVSDIGGCLNFAILFLSLFNRNIKKYNLIIYGKDDYIRSKRMLENSKYSQKINLIHGDARNLDKILKEKSDIILMVNVLEHIPEDEKVISLVYENLKKGDLFFISVPTPYYKEYFGENFHRQVGHVRDGYFIEDLNKKCKKFQRIFYKYYTNEICASIMGIYYKYLLFWNKFLAQLYYRLTFPWMKYILFYLDKINMKKNISLFYVCKKR